MDVSAHLQLFTADECAEVFFQIYKNEFKYIPHPKTIDGKSGDLYQFVGHRWNVITYDIILDYMGKNSEYVKVLLSKQPLNTVKYSVTVTDLLKKICPLFYDKIFEQKLDNNRDLLGFNNGVYSFESGCLRDGRPDDYVSLSVGYDYKIFDENGENDEDIVSINTFLSKICDKTYLTGILASFLRLNTNRTFNIWSGGWSQLLKFFESTIGPYAIKLPSEFFLQNRQCVCSEPIDFKGIRFISSDLDISNIDDYQYPPHHPLKMGIITKLISSDDNCQFNLVLCSNNNPFIDGDRAVQRARMIDFKYSMNYGFDEISLMGKEQAFMYILLEHSKKNKTLSEPDEIRELKINYMYRNCQVQPFIDECLEKDNNSTVSFTELWRAYICHFRLNYIHNPLTKMNFKDKLHLKFLKKYAF